MDKPETIDELIERLPEVIDKLEKVEGVKVLGVDKVKGNFKIEMAVPYKQPLLFVVESINGMEATLKVKKIPKITPPSYLQVEKILLSYDYNINTIY